MAVTPEGVTAHKVLDLLGIEYLERPNRLAFCCPFHHDTDPSAGFYVNTQLAHCFSCSYSYNPVQFYARFKGIKEDQAERDLEKEFGVYHRKEPLDRVAMSKARTPAEDVLEKARSVGMIRHAFLGEELDRLLKQFEQGTVTPEILDKNLELWYNRVSETVNNAEFDPSRAPAISPDVRLEERVADVPWFRGSEGEVDLD